MEQEQITTEFDRLFEIYQMIDKEDNPKSTLVDLLLVTNSSFFTAFSKAGDVLGDNGKLRRTYDGNKEGLSRFNVNPTIDYEDEENSIKFTTECVRQYLKDKMDTSSWSASEYKDNVAKVNCLLIQMISSGMYFLIDDLQLPEYSVESVHNALEYIESRSQEIFTDFIEDLKELDNDNKLVIEFIEEKGVDIFGMYTKTKAIDYFKNIVGPIIKSIKNYSEVYKKWLFRRGEFFKTAINPDKTILYKFFNTTADAYNKKRAKLTDEFTLKYSTDENIKYIYKLIYGI